MKFFITFLLSLMVSSSAFAKKIELTESNHILLRGAVTEESVGEVIQYLTTSKEKEVMIFIDSPGGSVIAGWRLMNVIENGDKKVTCIASSAMSMGFAILQSCHKRYVMEDSIIMQHVMSYSLQNGQEPNNYQLAKLLHRINIKMDKKQAKRLKMSYSEFRKKVRDDWWMFGNEAVFHRAADGVAKVTCSTELAEKVVTRTQMTIFGPMSESYSGCPLNPAPVKAK